MKILVTGGAGFIGSHVADAYLAAGHEVAVLDDFSTGKRQQVADGVKVYEGNIENEQQVKEVLADFRPGILNHHAAQISVVVSTREPVADARRNILGTLNLMQAVKEVGGVQKFIYASSGGAMYGNPKELPCVETTVAEPVSPYGLSKYVAERYLWLLAAQNGQPVTVLRYSNVYGPRQDPHGEAGVCAIFSGRMLAGEPVTIFGDGSQVRDYIYVGDVAAANVAALSKGEGEAYNICTGSGTSTRRVYEVLRDATQYSLEAEIGPERPGEVQEVVLSPRKAQEGLQWQAEIDFTQGIAKTIDWYRSL